MINAFTLRKVAIQNVPWLTVDFIGGMDESLLSVFVVPGPAFLHRHRRLLAQQGNAVMAFLTEVFHVISQ